MTEAFKYISFVNFPPHESGDVVMSDESKAVLGRAKANYSGRLMKVIGEGMGSELEPHIDETTAPLVVSGLVEEVQELIEDFPRELTIGLVSRIPALNEGVTV